MDKKRLPVIEKSLMPEVLPDPVRSAPGLSSPRERVRARFAQLSERASVLAAAAGLAAACNGSRTPYSVVDEIPDPYICPSGPNPSLIEISAVEWQDSAILVHARLLDPMAAGYVMLSGFRAQNGIMVHELPPVLTSSIMIRVSSDIDASNAWPAMLPLELSFVCDEPGASKHYALSLQLDTSQPAASGAVPFELRPAPDAGI